MMKSSETEWTELYAKAFMERGYWRRIRTGEFKEALELAAKAFMRNCLSNRKRMCSGLMLLDPDTAVNWCDYDYCTPGRDVASNGETGLVGLHFGAMQFNTYRLKPMEEKYPGLGSYILALLEKLPVSVATPLWTLDAASWLFWGGCEDYEQVDEWEDEDQIRRKDVDKIFDSWMLDNKTIFHDSPIGSYEGNIPELNTWFCNDLKKLEDSLRKYYSEDYKRLGFSPFGIDIPGIVLECGKRDKLTNRMIDSSEENMSQVASIWSSGYIFQIDEKTDMQAVFDEIELVVEIVNNAVDLLLSIEYVDLKTEHLYKAFGVKR